MALKSTHVISFSLQVIIANCSAAGLESLGFSTIILIQVNPPPSSRWRAYSRWEVRQPHFLHTEQAAWFQLLLPQQGQQGALGVAGASF